MRVQNIGARSVRQWHKGYEGAKQVQEVQNKCTRVCGVLDGVRKGSKGLRGPGDARGAMNVRCEPPGESFTA